MSTNHGQAASPAPVASPASLPGFAADLAGADRCVLCGMCVPHCPTYAMQRMEGDSPRGRITLMQGLAQGRLEPDNERLRGHLQGCLGCRSCEAVCPAGVRFGELMDTSRRILREHPGGAWRTLPERLFGPWRRLALRRRPVRRMAALAARAVHRIGLRRLFPASSRLGRVLRHTGPSLVRMPRLARLADASRADVWLFTGCMDAFFTGPDSAATLELLHALGIRAGVPPGQVCCGAMDQHLGRTDAAAALQRENEVAFGGTRPILVLDSGCEAQLREYPGDAWRERVTSLTGFLAQLPVEDFRWRSDPVRVALHLPCTLRNVTRESDGIRRLFERLPGIALAALIPPQNCCGAAGTAMLTQPAMADPLGQATLSALEAAEPDVIVSPNVGCSVHLRALQQRGGTGPRIVSPARFLRERLASPGT
ncbi:(Fe-S)-binding protein [Thioalkalivibrio sp.]|uniref:(Fe-S)-binding protein n=1 Tax=Thioalkalivibrio sp. TaxID=2093813 RepID=UPI0025DE667D|nr:(Fe-S)-binding protein [Thioalkalivibrio sp.]